MDSTNLKRCLVCNSNFFSNSFRRYTCSTACGRQREGILNCARQKLLYLEKCKHAALNKLDYYSREADFIKGDVQLNHILAPLKQKIKIIEQREFFVKDFCTNVLKCEIDVPTYNTNIFSFKQRILCAN